MLFLCIIFSVLNSCESVSPSITISQGVLEGFTDVSTHEKEFYSFLGIPYAKPPVGERRFEPPEPAEPWSGTLYASSEGSECIQFESFVWNIVLGAEDCLFINVFTRQLPEPSSHPNLPVFVFIHGGGFQSQSSSPKVYGPQLLMNRNIILVTFNYRVGVLGFLSTGDSVVPGNMGLKDQVMALKWVQKNIAAFGGDPNRVTIFGESAGGASVHYHMLSRMSKGLFHAALSLSGCALNPWAFRNKEFLLYRTKQIAKQLNCPTRTTTEMMDCLREEDSYDITLAGSRIEEEGIHVSYLFGPTDEHDGNFFLSKPPLELVKQKIENDIPWVVGFTNNEGLFYALKYSTDSKVIASIEKDSRKALSVMLEINHSGTDPDGNAEKIAKFYTKGRQFDIQNLHVSSKIFTHRLFKQGIYNSVKYHHLYGKRKAPTYFYELTRHPERPCTVINVFTANRNTTELGVGHTDDLGFFFQTNMMGLIKSISSPEDIKISNHFLDMLINLGTHKGKLPPENWKPVSSKFEYTIIKEDLESRQNYILDSMELWNNLNIPENGQILDNTTCYE